MTRAVSRVGVVLLTAGQGSRFGAAPKLLAELDGRPLVRHAAEAALAASARPVIAVLGAHAAQVRAALAGLDLQFRDNPDFAQGLSTSLRAGLAALPDEIDAAIVMLGDMPRIRAEHLEALIAAYRTAEPRPAAIVPIRQGRRGNPVLLDRSRLAAELAGLRGDRGVGPGLAARDDVIEIAMDDAVTLDVDTREALRALLP